MREPNAVNIAIFLDDVHEENGPLKMIPDTHRLGLIEDENAKSAKRSGDWRQHVSADLKYAVPQGRVEALTKERGQFLAIGPMGTVYAFHPSIVHSSANNLSLDRRALLLITYNAVSNAPENPTMPEFLVSRDATPIVPWPETASRPNLRDLLGASPV